MRKRRRPKFYFSFRSPFSWIAARVIDEQLTAEQIADIEFIPFWEPDETTRSALEARGASFLYQPMTREKHLYILQDVKRLTASMGYTHVWPIDDNPWWDLPNLIYIAARREGLQDEFRKLVYKARWEDGLNIHTSETMRQVCDEVGLSTDWVQRAPEDDSIRQEATDALASAHDHGAFGVPFFMHGFHKYWGVDRLAGFIAAVRGAPYEYLAEVRS